MQKVTFKDKINVKELSVHIQELRAEDVNEIKRAINSIVDGVVAFYQQKKEKNKANGYVGLNSDSKINASFIPYIDHHHNDLYYLKSEIVNLLSGKLGINQTAKNALNAHKLGNHPPEYYAKKDHNHDDIYQLKNEENGAFISSQKLLESKTGKALF
ncbi:hypothetical protein, partial [Tenacibaculum finnmarkense]|uniref:hypothetical protein n=1 Tax=Tenacibaculum finnmarkense TaxID=2781243 RepID=UPI00187B7F55